MIFKGSFTILAAVAAVVSTVNGAALGLEKRASTATCTLVALPSRAVPATVNLGARWNFGKRRAATLTSNIFTHTTSPTVLGRRLQLFLGGKAISVRYSSSHVLVGYEVYSPGGFDRTTLKPSLVLTRPLVPIRSSRHSRRMSPRAS
ncbi:hypothetical protein BKA70DRAFT_482279 [Coprinopsis sp. MPI-PUGE-AT-0042]|nr:hypothetical protein BKA70DRAFT_482279 [Coprinopsis sp. MPI-PUGE-AT-0042]